MNEPTKSEAEFVVKPSLPRNVLFSVTCVLFGAYLVHLAHDGRTDALPAYLVALLMTAGSVVLLSSHFPNASYLRLTAEGFEVREHFKSRYFQWHNVGRFVARRGFIGTRVEFVHRDPEIGEPVEQSLPVGFAIPASTLLQTMNEWRDRHGGIS